jgi:predicted DNA-binding transcriptional regulator AlpA
VSEPLLTAREFAAQLGVSTGALLRWTRAEKVPCAVKLPSGAIRYRPELIEPWLDEIAMGAVDRGVLPTRTSRARHEAYVPPSAVAPREDGRSVSSPALPTWSPPSATETEEDDHAC